MLTFTIQSQRLYSTQEVRGKQFGFIFSNQYCAFGVLPLPKVGCFYQKPKQNLSIVILERKIGFLRVFFYLNICKF